MGHPSAILLAPCVKILIDIPLSMTSLMQILGSVNIVILIWIIVEDAFTCIEGDQRFTKVYNLYMQYVLPTSRWAFGCSYHGQSIPNDMPIKA